MSLAREHSHSTWMESLPGRIDRPPVSENLITDVCVVGAGIAGLSTAYHLAREGVSVVLLDDGPVGGGQTQRTTAHLVNALDDRYDHLEEVRGPEVTRAAADSHSSAITRIESICLTEEIDCDFRRVDGYLFVPPGESRFILLRELAAAHRAGLTEVEKINCVPWPDYDTGPCLRFPHQAQFHPLKYLAGLTQAFERHGGRLHTGTHVTEILGGSTVRVRTDTGHRVAANSLVIATNTPINDLLTIHTKQAPYATFAIAARIPRGSVPWGLYWDTLDAYHYVRLQECDGTSDWLIVGGEDHKLGQETDQKERFERLEAWTRERFHNVGPVEDRWSGMVMETTDGLAFIGRNPLDNDNVYIATGDSGMGMTHGTIAGMLLSDLIQGRQNSWTEAYDPSRKPVAGGAWWDYVSENANVAGQYVRDWFGPGEVDSTDAIPVGEGAVIRHGFHKIAAFRDEDGTLHEMSAVCPHLGCIVHWNGMEKCWDCPCHGSRFDALGQVVNGPANAPLEPVHETAEA